MEQMAGKSCKRSKPIPSRARCLFSFALPVKWRHADGKNMQRVACSSRSCMKTLWPLWPQQFLIFHPMLLHSTCQEHKAQLRQEVSWLSKIVFPRPTNGVRFLRIQSKGEKNGYSKGYSSRNAQADWRGGCGDCAGRLWSAGCTPTGSSRDQRRGQGPRADLSSCCCIWPGHSLCDARSQRIHRRHDQAV